MTEVCLVTGCAGFIGSHVAERLLAEGNTVVGVDCYTDLYPRVQKELNVSNLRKHGSFEFVEGDITRLDLTSLMDGVSCVFHFAAHAGVRNSWGRDFATYDRNNILSTQMLLEASLHVNRFVYASSSSVYGEAHSHPTPEDVITRPLSPYGASKLAGESLCWSYAKSCHVPTIVLRLFSVFGPRQRPDMFLHRFIKNALEGVPIEVYGNGKQTRDFIYIDDVVEAVIAATKPTGRGEVVNVGSGTSTSLHEMMRILSNLLGKDYNINYSESIRGDLAYTQADITRARETLGFSPKVSLEQGLDQEVKWLREQVVTAT